MKQMIHFWFGNKKDNRIMFHKEYWIAEWTPVRGYVIGENFHFRPSYPEN